MKYEFPVQAKILKPVEEVFDAVYNPKKISSYFTTAGASAPLDPGTQVMWEFADFPGAFPVYVKEMTKNEKIVFEWEASDGEGKGAGYNTRVEMTFTAIDKTTTLVRIVETGWKDPEENPHPCVGNAQGWMQMVCCLKGFVEYGINLRKGFM